MNRVECVSMHARISPITIKSWFAENKAEDGLTILYPDGLSQIKIECAPTTKPLDFRRTKRHDNSKKGHCLCSK